MAHLFNRNILLGVSGGIAAYKSAELIRQLQELGASVRVIMTQGAQEFITPLTLQALSGNPVHTQLLDSEAEMGMGHIELARWADVLLIAPTTADLLARLNAGRADDLLTTVALATPAPLLLAPAMNQQMWRDSATVNNVASLKARGVLFVGPAEGVQACGDTGPGRMEDPAVIASHTANLFENELLAGKRVVITTGPTREALDPVRYISNHSSGKMGYALARAAVSAGAITTVVNGPVSLSPLEHVNHVAVESAQEMYDQCLALIDDCDIFIASAAVADYRAEEVATNKMKKSGDGLVLKLVQNPDIVAAIANHASRPFTVGFAAETNNVIAYAREKLKRKNLDMIIANDVSDTSIGFNSDQNAVTIISSKQECEIALASKDIIAGHIIAAIAKNLI